MTSTPEDAELLSVTDATAAIEQTIKRLRQAALFNNEFVLRDSEECTHFATTLQTLLSALKSRLLSPAPQNASNTDDLCAALLSASPATETVAREELAREIYTVQAKVLGEHPQWDEVKAAAASQPWQKKSLDFVYDTADALRSEFNITRKEQP